MPFLELCCWTTKCSGCFQRFYQEIDSNIATYWEYRVKEAVGGEPTMAYVLVLDARVEFVTPSF